MTHINNNIVINPAELLNAEYAEHMEFPVHAMPQIVQPLITHASKAIQCPTAFIGVPLLTALGGAIGTTKALEVKEGWSVKTALWTAIVGTPGTAKSPAFALASGPLEEIQSVWMNESEDYRKRILIGDTTVEALGGIMSQNPRGIILMRDELSGWISSMNQYRSGKGSDIQFYLSSWSGSSHAIDRKGDPKPIFIPETYLAVCGSVQPEILWDLLSGPRQVDGFASRFLIAYPGRQTRHWTNEGIPNDLKEPVKSLLFKLSNLTFGPDRAPQILKFSREGRQLWESIMDAHLEQVNQFETEDALSAHWTKMDIYAARIALILHVSRLEAGETTSIEVDDESVIRAIALINYFKANVLKFYSKRQESRNLSQIERIRLWAAKHDNPIVKTRDILSAKLASTAQEARELLESMEDNGLGTWNIADNTFAFSTVQHSAIQQNSAESESSKAPETEKEVA